MAELAWCEGCGNLLGRIPEKVATRQRPALETATEAHRRKCKTGAELVAAIRYASAEVNDDPDPAAVLAGAATAYLEEHAPTLFNDLSLSRGGSE